MSNYNKNMINQKQGDEWGGASKLFEIHNNDNIIVFWRHYC